MQFRLFVWSFTSHSRIFHSFGDVIIAGIGLQILTYARHSWPSSSEGSNTCHTYCDTGHSFIMVISEDPWHSHLFPTKVCPDQGSNPNLPYARRDALPLSHRCGQLENLRSECFFLPNRKYYPALYGFHFLFLFPFFSYFHNYIFAKPKVSNSFRNHMPCRLFNRKEVRTVISKDLKLLSCKFYLNVLKFKMNSK